MRTYDPAIRAHYDEVARTSGADPSATMADEIVRAKETAAILEFVEQARRAKANLAYELGGDSPPITAVDIGCGNGYTLTQIARRFPDVRCLGIEHNDALRAIAGTRADVRAGDARDWPSLAGLETAADVVVCQRVIINILDAADQHAALDNIVRLLRPGGSAIFIESFASGLARLNEARAEFGLAPIPPAIHNLPLPDDFFDHPGLAPYQPTQFFTHAENALSTHFFVSRVLHEVLLAATGNPFVRNSHFVKFLTGALPDGIGDYAPLRICAFQKAG